MDLPATYVAATESLIAALSISHQIGHVAGGLILYFGVLALIGPRRAGAMPFLAVLAAELLNEAMQAGHYGAWRAADTLGDIFWTLILPALLLAYGAKPRAGRRALRTALIQKD